MLCIVVKILNKNVSKYISEILYEISEIHTVTSQEDEQPNVPSNENVFPWHSHKCKEGQLYFRWHISSLEEIHGNKTWTSKV